MACDLVGRDHELRSILAWVDEAVAGSPRYVLVAGDAGIGKTSLVTAIAGAAADRGIAVTWGRATETANAPPFRPWRQVLRTVDATDLLDPVVAADPEVDRFSRFDAIAGHLARFAERSGGLLVILEDVHRADEPSLQLLGHLAEWTTAASLCVLATHRDRVTDQPASSAATLGSLARLPGCRRLRLEGLGSSEVAALLGEGTDPQLAERLAGVTGGNPLFVSEMARHLRSGGDQDQVPSSVVDAVRGRLGERSGACATVLRLAAVIGRDFPAGLVATALAWPARTCLDALDEAVKAGLIEPADEPGWFRFLHVLVRDGVEATLGATDLAETNRQVAEAIEVYQRTGDDIAAALARHWQAAAVLGYGDVAAGWCAKAALAADRRMAWEDAAQLYDRAVELAGPSSDPIDRHRWLLGGATARSHCDDIHEAVDRCRRAADAVRHLGRHDLLADAALVVEGRGGPPLAGLRDLAAEALRSDDLDQPTRARLLGQLTVCAFYLDPLQMDELSAASLAAAEASGDPLALVAAARARQMALAGPESAGERLRLATVIGDAGRALGRASVVQWEPIWRIDALIELGRLPEAVAEQAELRRRVEAVALPMSRWHLMRVEALLAQATGRFADALDWAVRCCDLFGRLEDPLGGLAMLTAFRVHLAMHTGFDDSLVTAFDKIDPALAPPFLGDLPILGPLIAVLGVGDFDRARVLYDRMAPMTAWSPPRFLWLFHFSIRMWSAIELRRLDDVVPLVGELSRHRGTHIAAGAGGLTYIGPVELWTGIGSAALLRFDDAVADLEEASRCCVGIGAAAFAVHADVELARALVARNRSGDVDRAATVLARARPAATRLGMAPWLDAIDELIAGLAPPAQETGPLSPRELEVAALVAEGLTNRAIGERLYVSERTAQNHVQHILTKLGLANRAHIAAWFTTR